MKKLNIEWPIIRGAVGVLGLCVVLSAILLSTSFLFRAEMQTDFDKHHRRFKNISQRYLAVDQEEKIIKIHYPRFVELYNQGVIGTEKRLNWLEALRRAGDVIKLPELRYQIESRKAYTPDYANSTGAYELYATSMQLNLGLLHEFDLSKLLSELNDRAAGLYNVVNCSLRRNNKTIALDPDQTNINAHCELLWFSIDLRGAPGIVL